MKNNMTKLTELLAALPPEWSADSFAEIQALVQRDGRKVVVLDDDPTGTQTVHDVPVLTEWSVEALQAELADPRSCMYVLTNTRAMPLAQAQAINREIGHNLHMASQRIGREVVPVSRSDSTLRGHYPGETDALAEALLPFDNTLIIPAFTAGLRRTIGDVHYVGTIKDGEEWLTPAGETEFARDKSFGYRASNLREWVAEKSAGRWRADEVHAISLDTIRRDGPAGVMAALLALLKGRVCVVNAAGDHDLTVAVLGILQAENLGRRYLFRTAASFVQMRAGIAPRPLLGRAELLDGAMNTHGGLVVVGSYVAKTSGQVAALLQTGIQHIEISVARLLDDEQRASEISRVSAAATALLQRGKDVVIFTSRDLVTGADAAASLAIGQRVSASVVQMVQGIGARPRYILAKGGITSSDLATQALGAKRAMVLGQILPGVPVWQLGPETRFPGLSYIVFPGNVGGEGALVDVVSALTSA